MKVKITKEHDAGIAHYREGTTCDLPDELAAELIELGVAVASGGRKTKKPTEPEKTETDE